MSAVAKGARTPAVVFLPGFMQRADAWLPAAGPLAERYPVALLEFETWTFDERLAEIREAAARGAALVGYSMGGRLALHAVAREPERYSALVLVGASAGIEDPAEQRARSAADEELAAWIERRPIAEVVARWEAQPVFATQSASLVASQRPGRLSHEPAQLARLLRSAGQGALPSLWSELLRLEL